jgi:hypothetical protein
MLRAHHFFFLSLASFLSWPSLLPRIRLSFFSLLAVITPRPLVPRGFHPAV